MEASTSAAGTFSARKRWKRSDAQSCPTSRCRRRFAPPLNGKTLDREMRSHNCTRCGETIDEADKRWDELRYTGVCPRCGSADTIHPNGYPLIHDRKYRTAWRRVGAGFVDGVLSLPVGYAHSWIFANVTSVVVRSAWYALFQWGFIAYSVLCHGLWGQTLGKRAVGVIVRDVTEGPLSMRQAVLRDAVPIALSPLQFWQALPDLLHGRDPLLPGGETHAALFSLLGWVSALWFSAEVVTMLTNRKRRAVHDFIAGSVVLRRSALPPNAPLERTGGELPADAAARGGAGRSTAYR